MNDYNEDPILEKICLLKVLKEGELVYAHPFNFSYIAYFGSVRGFVMTSVEQNAKEERFHIINKLPFSYCKVYGLWMPSSVRKNINQGINFEPNELLSFTFHVGMEEIERAMEKKNNPNYGLVKAIIDRCL